MPIHYEADKGAPVSGIELFEKDTLLVHRGGTAYSTTVSGGNAAIFGSASGVFVSGGTVEVSSGGKTSNMTIGQNGIAYVYLYGFASANTLLLTGGTMILSGGTAYDNYVHSSNKMYVSSGGFASGTCVSGGILNVSAFGKAVNTEISSKGAVHVYYNGIAKDTRISNAGGGGEMYVSNGGTAINTVTYGRMIVGLGGFASKTTVESGTMLVSNGGSALKTTVSRSSMTLSLGGMATSNTVSSGGSLIVANSGRAGSNSVKAGGSMLVSNGGTATKTAVASNGTMLVSNGGSAAGVTVRKDGFLRVDSGAVVSDLKVSAGGSLVISSGAVVQGITNKCTDFVVSKGAVIDNYKGVLIEDYPDADDGWNNYRKGEKPATNPNPIEPQKIAKPTTKLLLDKDDPENKISHNGPEKAGSVVLRNFVGFTDDSDFGKLKMNYSGKLSFRIEATGAVKFTIYQLVEKDAGYSLKALQTTALKKNKKTGMYEASTAKKLIERDSSGGNYYISVSCPTAKKGGNAYYNVYLNTDDCIYYTRGDDNKNDILVDSKNLVGVCETISLGLTSKQVQMDKDPLNYEGKWKNFVGHDDDTDYAKIELTQDLKATFTIEAKDAAKFTICKLVNNDGKYLLKTLQSKTLAKQKDGTYRATLTRQLKTVDDLYICMKSTNAKKGGNAYYNVLYTPVDQLGAALSGPEEDTNILNCMEDQVAAANSVPSDMLTSAGLQTFSSVDLAGRPNSGGEQTLSGTAAFVPLQQENNVLLPSAVAMLA